MKRLLELSIVLALVLPLVACGKKGELESPEGYHPTDEIEETDSGPSDD